MKRIHNDLRIGLREPVMCGEVQVNSSDQIIRTHQLPLLSLRKVAQINETKLAVGNEYSQRARIFGDVGLRLRFGSTEWIGLVCARQWRADVFACGSEHLRGDASEWQAVPRLHDAMLGTANCLLIVSIQLAGGIGIFHVGAMVYKCANLDLFDEFRNSPNMVAVVV